MSRKEKKNYLQVGVQTYGGGLWHTWFDRDLGIAGRVVVDDAAAGGSGKLRSALVRIDKPILRVSNLAIHLDRSVNDSFNFNKETHLTPVLGLQTAKDPAAGKGLAHHPELLGELARQANAKRKSNFVQTRTNPECSGEHLGR